MGFEVEVKYRSVDHERLVSALADLGAETEQAITQEDTYLNHPSRDFAATNEAFRIRRIGEENRITYKGPRRSGPTKTREEIEIGLSTGKQAFIELFRLFECLGFRPVATIKKIRTPFHLIRGGRRVEVVLDRADGLGDFVEIETLAATENDLPAAQAVVLALAGELGLNEVEPRSYLRMWLEAAERDGTKPALSSTS